MNVDITSQKYIPRAYMREVNVTPIKTFYVILRFFSFFFFFKIVKYLSKKCRKLLESFNKRELKLLGPNSQI